MRSEGTRRVYALDPTPLRSVDEWLDPFRQFWVPRLDALATEIARGKKARRESDVSVAEQDPPEDPSAFEGSADGQGFIRLASERWAKASVKAETPQNDAVG